MKTRREKIDAIIDILFEARNELQECESSLVRIYQHIIKCYYQPDKHSRSWDYTIIERYKSFNRYADYKVLRELKSPQKQEHILKKACNAAIKDMEIRDKKEIIKVKGLAERLVSLWNIDDIYSDDFLERFFKESPKGTNSQMYSTKHIKKYLK